MDIVSSPPLCSLRLYFCFCFVSFFFSKDKIRAVGVDSKKLAPLKQIPFVTFTLVSLHLNNENKLNIVTVEGDQDFEM